MCMYICIWIYVYVYMYIWIYGYMDIFMYVYMYICISVYMYVCIYVQPSQTDWLGSCGSQDVTIESSSVSWYSALHRLCQRKRKTNALATLDGGMHKLTRQPIGWPGRVAHRIVFCSATVISSDKFVIWATVELSCTAESTDVEISLVWWKPAKLCWVCMGWRDLCRMCPFKGWRYWR